MSQQINVEEIIKNNPGVDKSLLEDAQKDVKKSKFHKREGKRANYDIEPPFSRRFIKLQEDSAEDSRTVYLRC